MTNDNDKENHGPRKVRRAQARKINRVGSREPHIATITATTIGQRMVERRIGLGLTQEQVANQVIFRSKTGRNKGSERTLSRATLAMYEIDQTEPDLQKIESIAKALGVTPGWLAFGEEVGGIREGTRADDEANDDIEISTWVMPKVVGAHDTEIPSPETRTVVIKIRR